MLRIGQGFDFHRYGEQGRPLILGGLQIPSDKKIIAHSDGDILIHALMDAILGALGLEDIGTHFPDTDPQYSNISSTILLEKVIKKMKEKGFFIGNLDVTLMAEVPKIKPYRQKIVEKLSSLLILPTDRISIKATTTEKMGAIGREEGLACSCVVLLQKKPDYEQKTKLLTEEAELPEKIEIFTDGACLGNPGPGGWSVVINYGTSHEVCLSGGEPQTTNNRMEITAALKAAEYLSRQKNKQAILYTDSTYVMKGITEWIFNWKRNGWKNSSKEPVANADLWQLFDNFNSQVKIQYKWVEGHSGNPGNEKCDTLARNEAKKFLETPSPS